jgi:Ni,Fe-hydrogenase maturation factor
MPPAAKTVGSVLAKVKELKQRSAIQHTLVQILRTRFLPSDGVATPLAQISCEGAPVSTDVIEEVVEELEEGVAEMEKEIRGILSEEI